jgi:hypothetical protein
MLNLLCVDQTAQTIEFDIQIFLPFLHDAVSRLVYLTSQVDDVNTKRGIAKALNVVVERAGEHVCSSTFSDALCDSPSVRLSPSWNRLLDRYPISVRNDLDAVFYLLTLLQGKKLRRIGYSRPLLSKLAQNSSR